MSEKAKQAYRSFVSFPLDREELSRQLLPFLLPSNPSRSFLLKEIQKRQSLLLDFDFSSGEFDLLQPEKYSSIFLDALKRGKFELVFSIGKATGLYGICCGFATETSPKEMLEELDSYLYRKSAATCYIPEANVDEMLHYGLIPYPEVVVNNPEYTRVLELYREGFTPEEIAYWTGIRNSFEYLGKVALWTLVTRSYVEEETKVGNSYSALLLFPELLYESRRPKTSMGMFCTPVSCRYSSPEEIPGKKIAVTRYSQGMSKGLFYGDRPSSVCGLFYYHEPDSSTYLSYKRGFKAFNKTAAAIRLSRLLMNSQAGASVEGEKLREMVGQALRMLSLNKNAAKRGMIMKHIKGSLPEDLRFTPKMAEDLFGYNPRFHLEVESEKSVYLGDSRELDLYAYEDPLDQPLCKLASFLRFDVVILTNMVGSHQVVTEVLDTRKDSIKHLYFEK
jgi:hypothetical protein